MRTSHPAALVATGTIFLLVVSCGSKKDANKGNFLAAIQAELDKEPVCIVATLPQDAPSGNGQMKTLDQLEPLVRASLVKRTETMVHRSQFDVMLEDRRPKQIPGYRYELSDLGKKYVMGVRTLTGMLPEICYGKKKVEEVVRFTEPSSARGMTVSQVSYTWKPTDIAAWARDPDIEKMFYTSRFLNAANIPQEAKMDLVLSNDGWHFASAF
jgi:hypothetical protein